MYKNGLKNLPFYAFCPLKPTKGLGLGLGLGLYKLRLENS